VRKEWLHDVPMLAFPKKRPLFVDDDGGGGFWICDAVGARDERMLYVRCILLVCCVWCVYGYWVELVYMSGGDWEDGVRSSGKNYLML
jgi:hypothetical protein